MIKNLIILLTIFSVIIIIVGKIFPIHTSEIIGAKQQNAFNNDFVFIQKTLMENHPGVCNALDPHFVEDMQKIFKNTQKLFSHASDEEKIKILQEMGDHFHDSHLWILYDRTQEKLPIKTLEVRTFSLLELKKGTYWIDIPNFHPSKDQIHNLKIIIESLPHLRNHTIVFDLRGNSGGNSSWGEELLNALFGEEYVNQQLTKSRYNVYADWRISQGNLEHVKGLIAIVQKQFWENHPSVQTIKDIEGGMKIAYSRGEKYYSELPNIDQGASLNAVNSFNGQIIAVIDKKCGSSCLDFLDHLKAMKANVIFVGETTSADSVYMELRKVILPSGKGTLAFPVKVYRNRLRGHQVPHVPNISYNGHLQDTAELKNFFISDFQFNQ